MKLESSRKTFIKYSSLLFFLCGSTTLYRVLAFSTNSFHLYSHIKFHENPSNGSWVVPCGLTEGRTDGRDEAIVAFLNSAIAPYKASAITTEQTDLTLNISTEFRTTMCRCSRLKRGQEFFPHHIHTESCVQPSPPSCVNRQSNEIKRTQRAVRAQRLVRHLLNLAAKSRVNRAWPPFSPYAIMVQYLCTVTLYQNNFHNVHQLCPFEILALLIWSRVFFFYIAKRNVFHYILSANKYLWRFSSRIYVIMGIKGTKHYLFSLSYPLSPELLCLNCS